MKKRTDIEKLVQWALREELPKGRPVSVSPWQLVMSYGMLGARIQSDGGGVDGFGFVPGSPHEDAERIGAAIARLPTSERLATDSDVRDLLGEWVGIGEPCIPKLLAVKFSAQALVISKATTATRPKWEFETPTPYPVKVEYRNSLGAIREHNLVEGIDDAGNLVPLKPHRGRAAMKVGLYDLNALPRSPLSWGDPSLFAVVHARAEYSIWQRALAHLASELANSLVEFEPVAPAARERPWITGQVAESRVLSDGKRIDDRPLPLAPKRKAAGPPLESAIEAKMRAGAAEYRAERRRQRMKETANL